MGTNKSSESMHNNAAFHKLLPQISFGLSSPELGMMTEMLQPTAANDHARSLSAWLEPHTDSTDTTVLIRMCGDSMESAGIYEGDTLIVERATKAVNGTIVVAVINGEMTVKRLFHTRGRVLLYPENVSYAAIEVTEDMDFEIWGIVRNAIRYFE